MSAPATLPSRKRLLLATLAALLVALVVLVLFILPAEYGLDPTGVGSAVGLTKLAPTTSTDGAADPSGESPETTTPSVTIQAYASSFPTTSTQVHKQEGYLAEGDTLLIPFPVDVANVTRVRATLEFNDANTTPTGQRTRPDTFEVELKAPHGDVTGSVLGRSDPTTGGGMARAVYESRVPPHPREFDATSLAEAQAAFHQNDPPDTSMTGEWLARVSLIEAQDGDVQGVPLGAPSGPAADEGNSWALTITIETYTLSVAAKPGTTQRSDTASLAIPAGGELEYKLLVNLGKRVDYSWYTNGPVVYVDFHGEKSGDASGAFTRHKNGDYALDAGTLVAPFDGRHGWFWRNTSGEAVTITLETRGVYEVIGRV